ncbi:MAG: hypothetical protein NUW22_12485 [Acidobacteria bacterium]|nr:hypothetical protein [Acidobacteriota bacterium]
MAKAHRYNLSAEYGCTACGYVPPSSMAELDRVTGQWVTAPIFVPCACQVAAAKAAMRAKFERHFTAAS